MYYLISAAVLFVIFILLCIREKRRFYNAVLLFATLVLSFVGVADVSYKHGFETISNLLTGFLYGIVPLAVFILVVTLIVDTFVLMIKEGKRVKNLLPLAFAVFLVVGCIFTLIALMGYNNDLLVYTSVFLGGITVYCSSLFVIFLVYSLLYSLMPKNKNADYIIIHGSGLIGGKKVPPLLASRIDKGIELYKRTGEKAVIIASGGRGSDEDLSEAQAIHDYMINKGIPETSIIIEDKSVNTQQNIEFSKRIIDERQNGKEYRCLFVTSNYHVFRTSLLARKAGLKGEGVGAKTKFYYWITAFLREYVAIAVRYKWVMIAFIAVLLALIAYSRSSINF